MGRSCARRRRRGGRRCIVELIVGRKAIGPKDLVCRRHLESGRRHTKPGGTVLARDKDNQLAIRVGGTVALEQEPVRHSLRRRHRERHRATADVTDGTVVVVVEGDRLAGLFTERRIRLDHPRRTAAGAAGLLRVGKRERHGGTGAHEQTYRPRFRCQVHCCRDGCVAYLNIRQGNRAAGNAHSATGWQCEKASPSVRARVEVTA